MTGPQAPPTGDRRPVDRAVRRRRLPRPDPVRHTGAGGGSEGDPPPASDETRLSHLSSSGTPDLAEAMSTLPWSCPVHGRSRTAPDSARQRQTLHGGFSGLTRADVAVAELLPPATNLAGQASCAAGHVRNTLPDTTINGRQPGTAVAAPITTHHRYAPPKGCARPVRGSTCGRKQREAPDREAPQREAQDRQAPDREAQRRRHSGDRPHHRFRNR